MNNDRNRTLNLGGGYDTRRLYHEGIYIDNTKYQWYSGDCISKGYEIYTNVTKGIFCSGVLCRIGNNVYLPKVNGYSLKPTPEEDDYILIEDEDISMGIYDYLPECWVIHLINNGFLYNNHYQLNVFNHNELVSKGFQRD